MTSKLEQLQSLGHGNLSRRFAPDDTPPVKPKPERQAKAKAALASATGKRGRPKATTPKPWEAAGLSRAAWYRQQKGRSPE